MSGVRRPSPEIMRRNGNSEVESEFKRRTTEQRRCWKVPRRYQVAIMCCLAFAVEGWMIANFLSMFFHIFFLSPNKVLESFSEAANWTVGDLNTHLDLNYWGSAIVQIPAAILTVYFPSHKIMLFSVVLSSILHMVIPLVIYSSSFITGTILFLQGITTGPIFSACMGVWKDWAPVNERTSLLVLAFTGRIINLHIFIPFSIHLVQSVGPFSIYNITGIAGLVWGLLWNSLIYESPSSDPLITAEELSYLEERIPPENKEKFTLKSIPFKSILLSPPVLALVLVFFSAEMLGRIMLLTGIHVELELGSEEFNPYKTQWIYVLNYIILIPAGGFIVDFLINRFRLQTQMMRKILCSGGLILHAVFLFLAFVPHALTSYVCFVFSLVFLSLSFVGYMPNVIEISPRFVCIIIAICTVVSHLSGVMFEFVIYSGLGEKMAIGDLKWKEISAPFGILGLITGIVFAVFASSNEQSWSQTSQTSFSKPNDSKCYPRSEVEDDTLVSETV